jgi:hypothetical protein
MASDQGQVETLAAKTFLVTGWTKEAKQVEAGSSGISCSMLGCAVRKPAINISYTQQCI